MTSTAELCDYDGPSSWMLAQQRKCMPARMLCASVPGGIRSYDACSGPGGVVVAKLERHTQTHRRLAISEPPPSLTRLLFVFRPGSRCSVVARNSVSAICWPADVTGPEGGAFSRRSYGSQILHATLHLVSGHWSMSNQCHRHASASSRHRFASMIESIISPSDLTVAPQA